MTEAASTSYMRERALGPLFEDLVDDPDARREFQDLVHESYESVHRGKPVTAIHRSVVTARLDYLTPDAWAEEMARQGAKPEKLHYEARLDALKKFTKGTDDEWLELPDVRRQELFRELREAFRLAHALPKMLGAAHQEQVLMSIALRGEEDDEQ